MEEKIESIILKWWNKGDISDEEFELLQIELFKKSKANWLADLSAINYGKSPLKSIRVFANAHNQIVIDDGVLTAKAKSKMMNLELYEKYAE